MRRRPTERGQWVLGVLWTLLAFAVLFMLVAAASGVLTLHWSNPPAYVTASTKAPELAGRWPLACTNGAKEKAWTKLEAEAAVLYAQKSLDTARHYQVPALKQAWAMESIAASLVVLNCWR